MSIDQGRHSLGVDFGTSNTVAVARWPDGRARPILVDGSPLLPSAVYAEPGGHLAVGRDAVHSARRDPARFEPNPKRRIDDGLVLLGDQELEVVDLIAAVLVRVADEWHRAVGPVRPEVTLTCPATWGATRRGLLAEAAGRAGLERARLVAEPVAAATYFAEVLDRDVPIGSVVVVHDFGAGTFDASVVARTAEGFEVLAVDGRDDVGGLDVDAAIVEHIGKQVAERDAAVWQRLSEPETLEDRRAQRQLWDDARIAKERLSRIQSADVVVPLLDLELHVTREELEELARPVLEQTVRVTRDLLRWADLAEGRLAGVFLVGGASRIPLVATLLHRELGEAPVVIEQPELVVAEGSILAHAALLATEPAAPGPTAEMSLLSLNPDKPPRKKPTSIDDMETVASTRQSLVPSADQPPPAVDPWPDAQQHWVPDPDQTVASDPSWDLHAFQNTPVSGSGTGSAGATGSGSATGSAAVGSGSAKGSAAATRPLPAEPARKSSGKSGKRAPSGTGAQSAGASPASAPSRSGKSVPVTSRPVSPSAPGVRPVSADRSGSADRSASAGRPGKGAHPTPTKRWDSPPVPPGRSGGGRKAPAAAPPRRRSGGVLRFFQFVLSFLFLVTVPLVALLAAYSVSAGVPMDSAVELLLDDVARLLG